MEVVPQESIAHDASDHSPVGGGGVRAEKQAVGFKKFVQLVVDYARLDPDPAFFRVKFQDLGKEILEVSTTIPSPTHCPAREVPAVRGIRETRFARANWISRRRSSLDLGLATAMGHLR